LGLLSGKKKKGNGVVGVCLQETGASIAGIKRPANALPVLITDRIDFPGTAESRLPLEEAIEKHNLHHSSCVDVLAGDSYQLVQVDMAGLSLDEGRAAARWQIGERIDYPPEEAVIDLFDIAPFGSDRKPQTYAVAARQTMLRRHLQVLGEAGLKTAAIDIAEFALRNVCDLFTEDSRGLGLLLLLEESGMLAIVRGGVLYLFRLFHTGMNSLLPHADGAYEALTDQLDAIVLEIQRSFDFCESTFNLPMVSRLLVAQTQRHIPALITYLNEYLATSVEPLDFSGMLDVPAGTDQIELNRHLLAIGGALRQESN
jgi:MSHA biogenesis protein MshI